MDGLEKVRGGSISPMLVVRQIVNPEVPPSPPNLSERRRQWQLLANNQQRAEFREIGDVRPDQSLKPASECKG